MICTQKQSLNTTLRFGSMPKDAGSDANLDAVQSKKQKTNKK